MRQLVLIFCFFQMITYSQIDDTLIEKARMFLYLNATHHRPFYIDTINQAINEKPYELSKKIPTSLMKK